MHKIESKLLPSALCQFFSRTRSFRLFLALSSSRISSFSFNFYLSLSIPVVLSFSLFCISILFRDHSHALYPTHLYSTPSLPLSHSSKALINTAIIKSCGLLLFKTFNGYVYPFIEIRYKKQTQRIHLLRMAWVVTMEMKNYFMFLYDVFILVNFSPTV